MVAQGMYSLVKWILIVLGIASVMGNIVLIWLNTRDVTAGQQFLAQPLHPITGEHKERSVVFADLSAEEYRQVRDYMGTIPDINISYYSQTMPFDDYFNRPFAAK